MPLRPAHTSLARRCLTAGRLGSTRQQHSQLPRHLGPTPKPNDPVSRHAAEQPWRSCSSGAAHTPFQATPDLAGKGGPHGGRGSAPLPGSASGRTHDDRHSPRRASGAQTCSNEHDSGSSSRAEIGQRGYEVFESDEVCLNSGSVELRPSRLNDTTHVGPRHDDHVAKVTGAKCGTEDVVDISPGALHLHQSTAVTADDVHSALPGSSAPADSTAHRQTHSRRSHANPRVRFRAARFNRSAVRTFTPAAYLMYALELTGNTHALPSRDRLRADPSVVPPSGRSLPTVLANHILATREIVQTAGSLVIPPQAARGEVDIRADEDYLLSKGYSPSDLVEWAALLTAKDIHTQVAAMFDPRQYGGKPPPAFLFMFLLRRNIIHARTLQILVGHAWRWLQDRRATSNYVQPPTAFIIFTRLLRHARRVWPEAVVNIAKIMSEYVIRTLDMEYHGTGPDRVRRARLSALYNLTLRHLAVPLYAQPFRSSIYQEIAQFDVLHAMSSQRPPLHLSRAGYQALTRVLLSRTKTERERDWTSLQASSWPPWKRSRTGVDEAKDLTYGMSRAAVSIQSMIQAGHGAGWWGSIAKLYAGRDGDGSPVVQTRSLLQSRITRYTAPIKTWEARIRTTRTVREAWACFLSYKDSKAVSSELVYTAMIVKLLLCHKTRPNITPSNNSLGSAVRCMDIRQEHDQVMAGDALEPLPEPNYPGDRTYVPVDPPSPMQLFEEMLGKGIMPSESTMSQLLKHARGFKQGFMFMDTAGAPYSNLVRVLACGEDIDPSELQAVPDSIYNSFVALLCKVPCDSIPLICKSSGQDLSHKGTLNQKSRRDAPAAHAMRLLFLRQSTRPYLWANLLEALADGDARLIAINRAERTEHQAILTLERMRYTLTMMKRFGVEPSTTCLMAVSKGIENAAIASHLSNRPNKAADSPSEWPGTAAELSTEDLQKIALNPWRRQVMPDAAKVGLKTSHFLRKLFHGIVSGEAMVQTNAKASYIGGKIPPIPRLLATPSPFELHAYVRALGILGDHEGIWSLVQWMVEHHESLETRILGRSSGKRQWTALLTAIRLFLECPSLDRRVFSAGLHSKMKPASEELEALARRKIEEVPDWHWPDKAAVNQYRSPPGAGASSLRAAPPSISDYI